MGDNSKSSLAFRIYIIAALVLVAGLITNFIPFDLGQSILHLPIAIFVPEGAAYWNFMNTFTVGYFLMAIIVVTIATLVSIGTRDIFELIGLFLLGMLPRERKQWGVVTDQQTKQPLTFLDVKIVTQQADQPQVVTETKTDSDGRYRLALNGTAGMKYTLVVSAEGYATYSRVLESYLTQGEDIVIDLALQKQESISETLVTKFNRNKPKYYRQLFIAIYFIYILVFGLMVFFLLNDPLFGNLCAVIIMGTTVVWNTRIIRGRAKPEMGRVVALPDHKPLVGAAVELIMPVGTNSAQSDAQGVVRFNIAAGVYRGSVRYPGFTMLGVDSQGYKIIKVGKEGYVSQDLSMQSISTPQVINARTLLVS